MKITKRELKNYEILQLFNEFVKNLNTEGLNPKYSLMLYKNIEALTIPYNNIIGSVYNEANDAEYQKYQHDLNDIVVKYADRDEQSEQQTEIETGRSHTSRKEPRRKEFLRGSCHSCS